MVKANAPFTRTELAEELARHRIGNRMLFGGNLVRQPAFQHRLADNPESCRVTGALPGADAIMNRALFVGVYPGLTPPMLGYVLEVIHAFCLKR